MGGPSVRNLVILGILLGGVYALIGLGLSGVRFYVEKALNDMILLSCGMRFGGRKNTYRISHVNEEARLSVVEPLGARQVKSTVRDLQHVGR